MSNQEQFANPNVYPSQPPAEKKSGWSGKKKVGVTVVSVAALAVSFFVGTEVGYSSAKADMAEAFTSAFGSSEFEESTTSDAPEASNYPVTLNVGDSIEIPCSMYSSDDGTCMTLTLTDADPNATCSGYGATPGRYVALTFDASMPADADPEFTSPFRSFPWSVVTADNRVTNADTDVACESSASILDLKAEFPGYSAIGTAWLPVPDNATEVLFDVSQETIFTVPLG